MTKDGALTSGTGKSFDLVTIDTGEPKENTPTSLTDPFEDQQSELAIQYKVRFPRLFTCVVISSISPSRSGHSRQS